MKKVRPCATGSPIPRTSVMNTSGATTVWPPAETPNSLACFSAVVRSPPEFSIAMTLAPELCAVRITDAKSVAPTGMRAAPTTLPPLRAMAARASVSSE